MRHSMLRGVTIGVIGAGKMGEALIKGLVAHGVSRRNLCAADGNAVARRRIASRYGVSAVARNADAVRRSQLLILAVKPQQMPSVVDEIAPHLSARQVVISIAAGISLAWLQRRLARVPVIRVMPNLPATVGAGFSALAPGRFASRRHRARALALFRAVGEAVELPERHFDAITAVSGSGPAYVFFLVQVWEAAARRLGLAPEIASRAIGRTLAGSVRLLQADRAPAAELVARVASKGGTTEAALKVLARRRVQAHFLEALRAAARRSQELSWSSSTS